MEKFKEYLERKDLHFKTVLDVGAWCGTWSNDMSKYADTVHAFEPDALHYECLLKNKKENVIPHLCAVGSQKAKVSLVENEKNFTQEKRVVPEGDILMTTVDSFALENIDLIKIDVEGYEMEVLKGGHKLLENIEFVMIELNNNSKRYGSNNIEIEEYLKSLGFKELIKTWPDIVYYKS